MPSGPAYEVVLRVSVDFRPETSPHLSGLSAGLYLFFHLRELLSAAPAFQDVLKGLWLLVGG
jgi:hypothetical protein